jgi:hypothetical protein
MRGEFLCSSLLTLQNREPTPGLEPEPAGDEVPRARQARTEVWPGDVTLIWPAHAHEHVDAAVTTGWPPTSTFGEPGVQGPRMTGAHGIGVSTPSAAAVAAATAGFAGERHIPNVGTFSSGTESVIAAAGREQPRTRASGSTTSALGAAPIVQASCAPATTTGAGTVSHLR